MFLYEYLTFGILTFNTFSCSDPELESIALPVNEGRDNLWAKTKEAFKYIYKHHMDDADWFLKADDDTYVIVENLRYMLYPYSPTFPIYLGCRFKPFVKQVSEYSMHAAHLNQFQRENQIYLKKKKQI